MYYDRHGQPITMKRWGELHTPDYFVIKKTVVPGGGEVSTVWLGIDHSFNGIPLIFETLVFGGPMDGEMQRYRTEKEALAGHDAMVLRVSERTLLNYLPNTKLT